MNYDEKFSEMSPIFKNVVIDATNKEVIGDHMYNYCKQNNIPSNKCKKLIGSVFGEKICMSTPKIKWLLEHGLIITKFTMLLNMEEMHAIKELGEEVTNARRAGDADKSMEIIAETMKLCGNSFYGRTVMDKEKHVSLSYTNEANIRKKQMIHILNILIR